MTRSGYTGRWWFFLDWPCTALFWITIALILTMIGLALYAALTT